MSSINDNFPVCRFNKEFIYVQSPVEIKNTNNFSDELILHIMNTASLNLVLKNEKRVTADEVNETFCENKRLDKTTSAIHLQIPVSDDASAFVHLNAYEQFEMSVPAGWSVSKWKKDYSGKMVNCSILSASSEMNLQPYETISVRIGNIVSQCSVGATYVQISLENVANATELYKTFYLLKKSTPLSIISFQAKESIVSAGTTTRLQWITAEKKQGKIYPNEFSLTEGVCEYKELLNKTKTYCLEIQNEKESRKSLCSVYVSPPLIRNCILHSDSKTLEWSVDFAESVWINGAQVSSEGSMDVDLDTVYVLSCCGYLYLLEKAIFPMIMAPLAFSSICCVFENYTVISISWNSKEALGYQLIIQEPEDYIVSDLSKGDYEYVYEHPSKDQNAQLRILLKSPSSDTTEIYRSLNWNEG